MFCDPQCPRWACLAAFPRSPTKRTLISPRKTPPDIFIQFSNNRTKSRLVWRCCGLQTWSFSDTCQAWGHIVKAVEMCSKDLKTNFKKRGNVNIYSVNTTQFIILNVVSRRVFSVSSSQNSLLACSVNTRPVLPHDSISVVFVFSSHRRTYKRTSESRENQHRMLESAEIIPVTVQII